MGLEKKSPLPPPRDMWPSFPRCTLLGFGASSSSTIELKANRLGPEPARHQREQVRLRYCQDVRTGGSCKRKRVRQRRTLLLGILRCWGANRQGSRRLHRLLVEEAVIHLCSRVCAPSAMALTR